MSEQPLILNRYRPLAEAGVGGYGTVQLAWDTRIQRRVAIKCMQLKEETLPDGSPASPVSGYDPARLPGLEEARTAAMLSDANIVGVFDFEVQGSTAYLIMEYIDGITLTQLMDRFPDDVDIDVVAAVFQGISHALEVAHENQVLHLDIKPDNILIDRKGQVKVTDFGLAKLSDAAGFGRAAGGTIGYMPLEQMRLESLDARCDEWALASLTYEMITGENPFFADDLDQAQRVIEDAELVLPSLCLDGLDPQADDVLFYALDPDREERYSNVEDFAEELQPFLGSVTLGHKRLRDLVALTGEDEVEEEGANESTMLTALDHIGIGSRTAFERVVSVVECGMLAFMSLQNVTQVGGSFASLPFWGLVALVVVAAAVAPELGSLLAAGSLIAALFSSSAFIPAGILVVATAAWWCFVGRHGKEQANSALSAVVLSALSLGAAVPLVCGYFLRVKDAVATAAYAALVVFTLGSTDLLGYSFVFGPDLFGHFARIDYGAAVQSAALWIMAAAWLIAAALMALCCNRQVRWLAFVGAVLSGIVVVGALCLGAFVTSGNVDWMPDAWSLGFSIAAVVALCFCTVFGVPTRPVKPVAKQRKRAK